MPLALSRLRRSVSNTGSSSEFLEEVLRGRGGRASAKIGERKEGGGGGGGYRETDREKERLIFFCFFWY
jgi:hypothetical protein